MVKLFNNKFQIFNFVSEILGQIIDSKGQKLLTSISDVKKLEKKIKIKLLGDLTKYLAAIKRIIPLLENLDLYYLPSELFSECKLIHQNLGNNISTIRSIQSLYKYSSFLEKFYNETSKIESSILSTLDSFSSLLFNSPYNIQHPDLLPKNNSPTQKFPEIWYTIECLKQGTVHLNIYPVSWMKIFEEIGILEEELKSLQKSTKNQNIQFLELFTTPIISDHATLSLDYCKQEFLYLLYSKEAIQLSYPSFKDKIQKKLIAKQLELYLNRQINFEMSLISKKYGILYVFNEQSIASKEIPHNIKLQLEEFQDQITQKKQGDLNAANKELQKFGGQFFQILDALENWSQKIAPIVQPWKQILRKNQNMINQLRGEINRKLNDFEEYSDSVQENNVKLEIEQKISKQIGRLETLLLDYQNKTTPYLENLPDLTPMNELIEDFNTRATSLKERMNKIFKEYSEKKINISSYIDSWEEKYSEILNRSKFSLRTSLVQLFDQFSGVLEKEGKLFNIIQDVSTPNENFDLFSTKIVSPEGFSEKDIRLQIEKITTKLASLDVRKQKYEEEKKRFLSLLEEKLNEKGLKSKKCIICHKSVKVAEDNYIKCEFCDSLSHYTCAVWWIQKYNSCPVCHNKYTVPGNELFDPNSLES
ncbi:hypothetical protein [Candidatus Lokiarchaeum ossiferum]|uniref:hypothetical protein n=1 Tax=Candidatus Lokiarchaeum ossiferum TaxID=2951803 RepID=UPI00352DAE0E